MKKRNCYIFIFVSLIISIITVSLNDNLIKTTLSNVGGGLAPVADIKKGQKVSQEFLSKVNNLSRIDIVFNGYGSQFDDEVVTLRLLNNNATIYQASMYAKEINGGITKSFYLDHVIEESKGKKYSVEVSCDECDDQHKIALFGGNAEAKSFPLQINNSELINTIEIYQTGTTFDKTIIILVMIIFSIIVCLIFYDLLKATKLKLRSISSSAIEFVLSLLFNYFLFKFVYICSYKFNVSFVYLSLIIASLCMLIVIFAYRIVKYKKVEELFLTLMIPIGLTYLTFMIPNQVADESVHYYSCYNIQKGDLLDFGYIVDAPSQIVENDSLHLDSYYKLDNVMRLKSDYASTITVTGSRYSSLFYVPGSIAVYINRLLKTPLFWGYYLGRILTFICYLSLVYIAIKVLPFGKMLLFVYLFNPMSIHQSISLSADSLMNAFCILYISYVLNLFHKEKLTKKDLSFLFLIGIAVSLTKYVYLPLILLSFLLLFKKNVSKKKKKFIVFSAFAAFVLCIGLFVYFNFISKVVASQYVTLKNVDMIGQLKFLLKNPLNVIEMFFKTIKVNGNFYFNSFMGQSLSWLNLPINPLIIYLYFGTLILSIFAFRDNEEPEKIEKIGLNIVCFGIFFLIILAMHLTWTTKGIFVADGVQGRYFLPIVIAFLLSLIKRNRDMKINNPYVKFSVAIVTVNVLTLMEIIAHFI